MWQERERSPVRRRPPRDLVLVSVSRSLSFHQQDNIMDANVLIIPPAIIYSAEGAIRNPNAN